MDIPGTIRDAMVAHARACFPEEACGLLAFDRSGTIRRAYCLTNAEHSSSGFTVDPDDHFASLSDAEGKGWILGGAFHSHPVTAAAPSQTDIAGALESGWLHVIIGFVGDPSPQVRGWRIVDGRATEEALDVIPPIASRLEEGGACR